MLPSDDERECGHCLFKLSSGISVTSDWGRWGEKLGAFILCCYGRRRFFWNIAAVLPDYTASYKMTVILMTMFCWPCITVYQYNETSVMQFSFNLLRIKGFYMFRTLLTHPQEVPHKWHSVYCVHIMSVGCGGFTETVPQPADIQMQYTKWCLCGASWGWVSNAWNV
jgi:hypothetical protein